MTIPGPPASVLAAVLRADPSHPYDATAPRQRRMAVFSASPSFPDLPSLIDDVVFLPQNATLDANLNITGTLTSQGWGTAGITAVTAAYTPSPADAVIEVNAAAGAVTITLPDATQPGFVAGQRYTVIKTDSSANDVTVTGSAGQKIGGNTSVTLSNTGGYISVVFDGSNWQVWAGYTTVGTAPSGPASGDLGGTYPAPTVTATHLAAALPAAQGGTGVTGSGTPSAGQVLMATSSSAAKWATHPVNWLNVVSEYGADPTGAADSTTAIQNALGAATAGSVVYLPEGGTYQVTSPLTVPTGVALVSMAGSQGSPNDNYGAGTLPIIGAVIKPAAAFAGTGVVIMTSGSGSTQTGGQILRGITIDGSSLTGTIHGIYAAGAVGAVTVDRCMVFNVSGCGLFFDTGGTGGAYNPDDWYVTGLKVSACKGTAGVLVSGGCPDSWWIACESSENTGHGWELATAGNTRLVGCKGENNGGTGFLLFAYGTVGVLFDGCSTQFNTAYGFQIQGNGTAPIQLSGCRSLFDGQTAANYAGLDVTACTNPVLAPGFVCVTNGTGPRYGAILESSSYSLDIPGSYIQGTVAPLYDDGTNTYPLVSPSSATTPPRSAPSPVTVTAATITSLASLTVPALDPVAGTIYELKAHGTLGTNATPPTATVDLRWGGTGGTLLLSLLTGTTAPALTGSLSGVPVLIEAQIEFVTAATVTGWLKLTWRNSATATTAVTSALASITSAVTVTTSSAEALSLDWTWSAAAAGTTISTAAWLRRSA